MHTFFINVSVLEKYLSNLSVTLSVLSLLIAANVCILLIHDTRELYTSAFLYNLIIKSVVDANIELRVCRWKG